MDQHYKILGLETTSNLEEVKKRFNVLYKEYNPEKQTDELKEFFKKEQEKVQDAYKEICLSFIRKKEEEEEEVIVKDNKREKNVEEEIEEWGESESSNTKERKVEGNETIDILNNIRSFSSLKKFTICSVFFSIILLFLPWVGDIDPINIVEMKNKLFHTIDIDDTPLSLNLFFYFGYITTAFLLFTIFKIYKDDYKFASLLQFFNIIALVLVIISVLFYAGNGTYESWIEDEARRSKLPIGVWGSPMNSNHVEEIYLDFVGHEIEEIFDDYKIDEDKFPFQVFHFTPIFFILLFLTNWILIVLLSRRKRRSIE